MSGFDPVQLAARLASFASAPRCWIAFSGGLDSSVLLSAAAAIRAQIPGALHAVHIDHGLQTDSGLWAARCQSRCEALAVPLVIRRLGLQPPPGASIEAIAHTARYRAFVELLGPGELLLTAHNRDDQAETLLLALLRGSGVQGLAAMPFAAPLGAGHLVRPLLDVTRDTLSAYARAQGLDWSEDPSNGDTALDRNYLRHRILPLLRERWPAVSTVLARSASHCAEAADLSERLAAATLAGLRGERRGTLDIPALSRLDRSLQKAALRLWIKQAGFTAPDARHLDRILDEVLPARADANPLVAWTGGEVRRYRDALFVLAPLPCPPSPATEIQWSVGDVIATLELPQGLGRLVWRPAVDGKSEPQRLRVRFGQTGLSCRISATGHARPLKKLFQEAGIPVWLRPYVPLIFADKSLLTVGGICRCRRQETAVASEVELHWLGHPWIEWLKPPAPAIRDASRTLDPAASRSPAPPPVAAIAESSDPQTARAD